MPRSASEPIRRPSRRRRLARRLLAAQALVIAAGAVTFATVALIVGPGTFHLHVERALGVVEDELLRHIDVAFTTSLLLSVGIGIAASIVVALVVSWLLSSRIARPIEELSATAGRIEMGDLTVRAAPPPVDDELAALTTAFNDMVSALEHTEATRQRLLSDLAHELRTPLATLEGYLEGLDDGVVAADHETWDTMSAAATRLHRLVDDVALVSRAEEGQLELQRERIAPALLVETAAAAMADAFRRATIDLNLDIAHPLSPVEVDPDRIIQVLSNILDNARHHTGEHGQVTIRAEQEDTTVLIEVIDSGEGLAADQLEHIFERFYRTDRARTHSRGSGIGLTIARAIAQAHGGTLTAHSDGAGHGATFRLRLPNASATGGTP